MGVERKNKKQRGARVSSFVPAIFRGGISGIPVVSRAPHIYVCRPRSSSYVYGTMFFKSSIRFLPLFAYARKDSLTSYFSSGAANQAVRREGELRVVFLLH